MPATNMTNIRKLASKITYVNKLPKSTDPECKFLAALIDDEMCEAALKLKRRVPTYIDEFAERLGKPYDETYKLCERMCDVGLCEWHSDDNGKEQINLPLFAPGSMELSLMRSDIAESNPVLAESFHELAANLTELLSQFVPMGKGLIKVLPVEKAIENESRKVGIEEVSWWVKKYAPSLGVATCQCRRASRITNEGTGDPEDEFCIVLGKFAESCIRTGRARRISIEEAYEILYKAEELGYVHEVTNVDGAENSMFICNCSWDTCLGLRTAWWCGTPNMSASNYVAEVDPKKCEACGKCMEVCPQNSVKLGQKICQNKPVEIPETLLPEDHIWTKKHWNTDLLTNRKNVVKETGTSPCKTACPAHVSVQAYLSLASEGRYDEALKLIKQDNPFPAVCGSICNHRCEDECMRGSIDEAVAIDDVKRFIAEKELDNANKYIPNKMYKALNQKIAVIGGGPAGLTCAYYLAVYGHEVTVFEKEEKPGGMMTYGIPAFRLEKNVVDAEIDVLSALGVEIKCGIEVGKDITINDLRKEGYKGIYLAIGAQGGRKLGVVGEEADGVISGIDFLRSINKGGNEKLSGKAIVIGGGNVAIDVARSAVRVGAKSVALYSLESREEMPAAKDEIKETLEEKVEINNGWGPKEIITENGKVKGVVFKRCTQVFDQANRFSPIYDENDTITVECDYVLTTIGQSIKWGNLLDGLNVKLNKNGTVDADSFTYQTDEPDIFVGGDVLTGPKFCIDAIAAGREGAVSLNRGVRAGHSLVLGRDKREFFAIDKSNVAVVIDSFDLTPRQIPAYANDKPSFKNDRACLTEEQIKKETSRCLECGAAHVDSNICIGCGLCTTRCKFDAIHLKKVRDERGVTYEQLIPAVVKYMPSKIKNISGRAIKEKVNK